MGFIRQLFYRPQNYNRHNYSADYICRIVTAAAVIYGTCQNRSYGTAEGNRRRYRPHNGLIILFAEDVRYCKGETNCAVNKAKQHTKEYKNKTQPGFAGSQKADLRGKQAEICKGKGNPDPLAVKYFAQENFATCHKEHTY